MAHLSKTKNDLDNKKTVLSTLCYIKHRGKTLMLHRIKKTNDVHYGKWNGIGGKLESGETIEDCVIREVKEETGLLIIEPILKGILTFPAFKDGEDWYVFIFITDKFKGKMKNSPEGVLHWIDDDKLFNLNLWEGDKLFLKWMEQPKIFSGKLVYKNKELVSSEVTFY